MSDRPTYAVGLALPLGVPADFDAPQTVNDLTPRPSPPPPPEMDPTTQETRDKNTTALYNLAFEVAALVRAFEAETGCTVFEIGLPAPRPDKIRDATLWADVYGSCANSQITPLYPDDDE